MDNWCTRSILWTLRWVVPVAFLHFTSAQINKTAVTCTYDPTVPNSLDMPSDYREFLRIDCDSNAVIHISRALYGVSQLSRCRFSTGDTCSENTLWLDYIRECNGKPQCKIPTYSIALECNPPNTIYSHYLHVDFQCLTGTLTEESNICGGIGYPDENYAIDDAGLDDTGDGNDQWGPPASDPGGGGGRRKRQADVAQEKAEDTLPHIDDAHYRVSYPTGFLTSPNYPHNYPNYMHCECYLQTQSDAYIVFRVLDFEIEEGQDCMYDYLQISIGPVTRKYCDAVEKDTIIITFASFMHLQMKSDDSVNQFGFWIQFWGQKTDGSKVAVRSKCGPYTGSEIPDTLPHYPGGGGGILPPQRGDTVKPPLPTGTPIAPRPKPPLPRPPGPAQPRPSGKPHTTSPGEEATQSPSNETINPNASGRADNNKDDNGLSMGIIIGAAAAGLLLILLLLIISIVMCRRRFAATSKHQPKHHHQTGISTIPTIKDISNRELPPAPNIPAPKVPNAPPLSKGEEYLTLGVDKVAYRSPPNSQYTTLDRGSNQALLDAPVPLSPPYQQYDVSMRKTYPIGYTNHQYTNSPEENIYSEIYEDAAKFPLNPNTLRGVSGYFNMSIQQQQQQQDYQNNAAFLLGANNMDVNHQNHLNSNSVPQVAPSLALPPYPQQTAVQEQFTARPFVNIDNAHSTESQDHHGAPYDLPYNEKL